MRFFFYGTLLDADLRRALCGPAADGWTLVPAELADHRRGRSPGRTYPFLLPAAGERVAGAVSDGLDATAAAVLTLYEGDGYRVAGLRPVAGDGRVMPAWAFLPRRAVLAPLSWTLESWTAQHKAGALKRLRAWRATITDGEVAAAAKEWTDRPAAPTD